MAQTLDEIRRRGLEALRRELGRTGLIRFLQQFETGRGDYAQERRQWVDNMSLEELRAPKPPRPRRQRQEIYPETVKAAPLRGNVFCRNGSPPPTGAILPRSSKAR